VYDKGKILTGVVIFRILLAFPMYYLAASGDAGYVPDPVLPEGETQCVEDADWMKDYHMTLLIDWRETVVRDGVRTYVAEDGKEYTISLTGTCLQQCHVEKDEFCDQCHIYVGAEPTCWRCHVETVEGEEAEGDE
jgi:hypothetical protein